MENVNFSEVFEGEDIERVLVGRKREAAEYVKAVEEGTKNILCMMDYVRTKKKNTWGTGETRSEIHDPADSVMTALDISIKELIGRV